MRHLLLQQHPHGRERSVQGGGVSNTDCGRMVRSNIGVALAFASLCTLLHFVRSISDVGIVSFAALPFANIRHWRFEPNLNNTIRCSMSLTMLQSPTQSSVLWSMPTHSPKLS